MHIMSFSTQPKLKAQFTNNLKSNLQRLTQESAQNSDERMSRLLADRAKNGHYFVKLTYFELNKIGFNSAMTKDFCAAHNLNMTEFQSSWMEGEMIASQSGFVISWKDGGDGREN